METRRVAGKQVPVDVAGSRATEQGEKAGQSAKAEKSGAPGQAVAGSIGGPNAGAAARPGINVALSPQARELSDARKKAFDIAKATPDIREDRVAELKRQIQSGTYQVDPGKIADGIAREALLEYLAESDGKPGI